eukprot:6179356-Pleurochrysis_carterae.AAC.4
MDHMHRNGIFHRDIKVDSSHQEAPRAWLATAALGDPSVLNVAASAYFPAATLDAMPKSKYELDVVSVINRKCSRQPVWDESSAVYPVQATETAAARTNVCGCMDRFCDGESALRPPPSPLT